MAGFDSLGSAVVVYQTNSVRHNSIGARRVQSKVPFGPFRLRAPTIEFAWQTKKSLAMSKNMGVFLDKSEAIGHLLGELHPDASGVGIRSGDLGSSLAVESNIELSA